MIQAVAPHARGEPGRAIVSGAPDPPGATLYEKKQYLATHRDGLRKLMLREPPGYADCMVDPDDPFQEGFTVGDIWQAGSMPGALSSAQGSRVMVRSQAFHELPGEYELGS